jgi:hypothetical protein
MSTIHPIGVILAAAFCAASLLWWLFSGITGGSE